MRDFRVRYKTMYVDAVSIKVLLKFFLFIEICSGKLKVVVVT
jgi:hypothetical protein